MVVETGNSNQVYVCLDADDVGAKIELLLLDERIDDAAALGLARPLP